MTQKTEYRIRIFLTFCIILILSIFATLIYLQMLETKTYPETLKTKSDIVKPFIDYHGGNASNYGLIDGYWVYCDSLRVFRVGKNFLTHNKGK
jgi:hypothetical protein